MAPNDSPRIATLFSDENCLLHRGDLATVVYILNHIDPIMKETISRDMKTDEKGAEIVSKGEAKIREVIVSARVLSIPEVTLHWADAVIRIVDHRKTGDNHRLKQEVIM